MRQGFVVVLLVLGSAIFQKGIAQDFPIGNVRIILPQAPGGISDLVARGIADSLRKKWNQPVIVESVTGASGALAAQTVGRAPPDGRTLLFSSPGSVLINPLIMGKVDFDPATELVPVLNVMTAATTIVVPNSSKFADMRALVEYAKLHPQELKYSTPGFGSGQHLETEIFLRTLGIKMLHVPYKSGTDAARAVSTGEVDINLGSLVGMVRSGQVRALAIGWPKRVGALPDVPTLAEAGYPNVPLSVNWFGLFTASKTPPGTLRRIADEASQIVKQAEFNEKYFAPSGVVLSLEAPEAFAARIESERKKFGDLIKDISAAKN